VLSPSHLLLKGAEDPWFARDLDLCYRLRSALDRVGHRRIDIYYSLAVPMREFRRVETRRRLIQALRGLPVDGLWLRISDFGSDSTGPAVHAYVEAAREA
jgi:hypothetical protein